MEDEAFAAGKFHKKRPDRVSSAGKETQGAGDPSPEYNCPSPKLPAFAITFLG
jgi:hypothetical protein